MAVDYIAMGNNLAELGMRKRESDARVLAANEALLQSQAMNPMLQEAQRMKNMYSRQMNPLLVDQQGNVNRAADFDYQLAQEMKPYQMEEARLSPQVLQSNLDTASQGRQMATQEQSWQRQDRGIAAQQRAAAAQQAQQEAVQAEVAQEQNQVLAMADQLSMTPEGSPERAQMAQALLNQTMGMKHLGGQFANVDPLDISNQDLQQLKAGILMSQGQGIEGQEFEQVKSAPGMTFNATTGRYMVDSQMMEKAAEIKRKAGDGMITGENLQKVNKDITPIIKDTQEIVTSAKELKALRASNSSTDQLAAVFKFMKALDPTSVVRETEQGMVYSASGAGAQFANMLNSVIEGEKLPEKAFDNVVATAQTLAQERSKASKEQIDLYLAPLEDNLSSKSMKALKDRVPDFEAPARLNAQQKRALSMFEQASEEEKAKFIEQITPEERKALGL